MRALLVIIVLAAAVLLGADDSPWIPTRIPALRYPILGLQARIAGKVSLRVSLDASGAVVEVRVQPHNEGNKIHLQ